MPNDIEDEVDGESLDIVFTVEPLFLVNHGCIGSSAEIIKR
jgi:hypothetical protein